MLKLLDQVVETVLAGGWSLAPVPLFAFSVPDEDWQKRVKADMGNQRVNIYLYEVRENRDFRRPDWDVVALADRTSVLSMPPAYFDCHYLISAWSPMVDNDMVNPVADEHQILGEVLRVLMRRPDVNPAALGVIGGGPVFQSSHVYLTVAPPEPPRVLNDFWGTMRLPWRPAVQLVATAPLDLLRDSAPPVPPVSTLIQHYALRGDPDPLAGPSAAKYEESILIGGLVLRTDGTPVAGATVRRIDTGEQVASDAGGRYVLGGLKSGSLSLHVTAAGLAPADRTFTVPAANPDDYVFTLT